MSKKTIPFWWQADDEELPIAVFTDVKALEEDQRDVFRRNVINARLFNNRELLSERSSLGSSGGPSVGGTHENVIQSVIETAMALIAKNRPKAKFLVDEADWSLQQNAKKLERFMSGLFRAEKVYAKGVKVFRDACVYGTGVMKVIPDKKRKRVKFEHVPPGRIKVNELEALSTMPRNMHEVYPVDKEVLKGLYPDCAAEIDLAHKDDRRWPHRQIEANEAIVVESYHLPSPGGDDGIVTICVEGKLLAKKKWTKDHFPYVFYRWSDPLEGFYGQGLAEQLMGIQLRINKLNKFIDRCQDLLSSPLIFVDMASKVSFEHLVRNEIARIVPMRGQAPVFYTPTAVGPEIYAYKAELKASAFAMAGIAEAAAQPIVPKRADSAPAVRAYNEIQEGRFAIQAKFYEDMFLELFVQALAAAKELHSGDVDVGVKFSDRRLVQSIKWSEVKEDADRFEMIIEAASILEDTPAGRIAGATELSRSGAINMEQAQKLIDHPDVQPEMDLITADTRLCDKLADERREGDYTPPEPFFPLQHHIERSQMVLLLDWMNGAPADVLELHQRYIEDCQTLMGVSQQAMEPQMAQPALAPESQGLRQVVQQITNSPAPVAGPVV